MRTQLLKATKQYAQLLAFLVIILAGGESFAQCSQIPVALSERVSTATLIIEGRVLESQGFYCAEKHNRIMTAHKVRLTKVFKGDLSPQTQEVIILTQGGVVGNKMLKVHPSITLNKSDVGVFLAEKFNTQTPFGAQNVYLPIEERQGFIQYDLRDDKAVEPFTVHQGIVTNFYPKLISLIGKPYKTVAELTEAIPGNKANNGLGIMVPPTVTSYSPNPVNAGIGQQVTITGTNFGTFNGNCQVEFADADDGGATTDILPQVAIVSWTNTQIVVVVPTTAGTGPVRVTNSTSETNTLAGTPVLTVNYNVTNIGTPEIDRTHHTNDNTIGGYTFLFNTAFFGNTPAVDAVTRAFETWRCGTGINFRIGCVTTPINISDNDDVNVIAFNNAELSGPSVLGTCFSYYSNCGGDWFIEDIDIIFRATPTNWNFGPGASGAGQTDFESVASHEIGHGHQLGHVINNTIVMNFSIGPGTDLRTLNPVSDVAGGNDVMAKNATFSSGGCLPLPETMTPVGSGICVANPLPAPNVTASPNPINSGSTISFGTNVTGATYNWTGPNGFTANVQNPTRTNMQLADAGVYSLTYTKDGCVSPVGTVTVTVNSVTNIAYQGGGENSPAGNPSCWGFTAPTQATGSNCVTVGTVTALPRSGNNSIRAAGGCSNGCTSGTNCITAGFIAGACSQVNGKTITLNTINIAPYQGVQFSVAHRSHNCPPGTGHGLDSGENLLFQVSENGGPFTTAGQLNGLGDYTWDYSTNPAGTGAGIVANPFVYNPSACVGNFRFQTVLSGATTMHEVYYIDDVQLTFTKGKDITSSGTTVCAGQTITFNANACVVADGNWNFQWQRNGVNLTNGGNVSGATTSTLTITTTAGDNGAQYRIVYSPAGSAQNGGCVLPNAISDPITITVNAAPATPTATATPNPICAGQTLTLTTPLVAGATYSWTGPNGFTSNVQNPTRANMQVADAGVYSLTITVAGCTSPVGTTANVTIGGALTTPTIGVNPNPICVGQTLNLTTPNVPGATYAWTGPNSFSSALQNPSIPSVVAANAGVYSLVVSVGGCTSPQATSANVVVNPSPTAPTVGVNPTILCAGGTINLTSSFVAGATYAWVGPNSFTSNVQNPNISSATVTASGIYSLTITVAGCTSPQATTATITVNPSPTTPTANANPTTLCAGQNLNLTTETQAGATYAWTGPNSFSSALQNPTITGATVAASGVYSLVVSIGACAAPQVVTTNIIVANTPTTPTVSGTPSTLCAGGTINLTSNFVAGGTYSWTGPNSFTSNLQNPTITGATVGASGVYSLTISIGTCTSPQATTATITVNPSPTTPTANANPTTLCAGQNLSLTTETQAGATYAWTGPNSFSSALQNPTITGATVAASGVYSLVISIGACAVPQVVTTNVTVNPTPATPIATATPTTLCAGEDISLNTSLVAGATYAWTGPNSFISNLQNPSITGATVAASGIYSLTITVAGCTSAQTTTTVVTVNPAPNATANNNGPLCAGQTLNLTAGTVPGATYAWTGPNSFTSNLQNPTITGVVAANNGIYSLVVTAAGCSANTTTNVIVVDAAPIAMATPTTLCTGQTLNLSTPFAAGATYNWTGPNSFSSNLQNPSIVSVTAAAAGIYSLTITISGCTSPVATTAPVVVNITPAIPTASVSPNPACTGQNLSLSTPTVPGATYSWIGPNSFTSNLQNPTINSIGVTAAGVYSLTVTANGCTSAQATTTPVVVNATPTAPTASATPATICSGQNINLTASTIAGATYNWTGPNTFSSALQNPSITGATVAASGIYSVSVSVNGCTSPVATTNNVTVNLTPGTPTPTNNGPVCEGLTLNLSTTNIPGATYNWAGPNGFTSITQNPFINNVTAVNDGIYSLIITVAGCISPQGTTTVIVTPSLTPPTPTANTPICTGGTLNLTTATIVGVTYSWSGPNGFTSNVQNPSVANVGTNAAGTYTVTISTPSCLPVSGSVTVSIINGGGNPNPASNSPVCEGNGLSFTSAPITGATYVWTGPNSFTSNLQNPTINFATPAATGTYTLTTTIGGCPPIVNTVNVVVNHAPIASPTSNSPVCEGNTLNLNTPSVTGAIYQWSGPNGFNSNVQNPSIASATPANAGTYFLTVSTPTCSSVSAFTIADVVGVVIATINSNSPLVVGQTLNLTANNVPGAIYNWTGPNSFTSNVQNPSLPNVSLAAGGLYSLALSVLGCNMPVVTTNVLVNPAPPAPMVGNNGPLCAGQTLLLTAETIAGATYQWSGPNGFFSFQQNPVINNVNTNQAGVYSLVVIVGGSPLPTATTTVVINPKPVLTSATNNGPLCAGQTLNLFTNTVAGATYQWSGPSAFSSAAQNPTIVGVTAANAGTYTVTASIGGCVSNPVTTTFSLKPAPAPISAGNNGPLCASQTLNLTATFVPGATYTWSGPGAFSASIQNPSINNSTTNMSGTYSVTMTASNGCSTPVATTTVVINPTPTATATNSGPVCTNGTITLNAGTVPGATYSWSGADGFSSSVQNPTVMNMNTSKTGVYSLTVSLGVCTALATTTVNLTAGPPPVTASAVATTICAGATINLSATTIAGATYAWTGPNLFSSAAQNPAIPGAATAASGTYSVIVTVSGCAATTPATVNVTVNPIPATPTASSNSPICTGQTINLAASLVPGATYNWTGPNGFISNVQNPSLFNANTGQAGTYTLNVTVNGCTSTNATTTVIINATPAEPVAFNNGPICAGQTLNLTTNVIAGATYSWMGPNNFSSNLQNPTIPGATIAASGSYSLSIMVNGCTSTNMGTTLVTIKPVPATPTITSNSPICAGQTLNLATTPVGGAMYSWTGPGAFTSNIPNPAIANATTTASGTYTLIITVNGCTSANATASVIVNPTPANATVGNNGPICAGATLNLTASTIAGATYSWAGPNGFTSGTQNPSITGATVAASGTYTLTVSTAAGCLATAMPTTNAIVNPVPTTPTASSNSPVCAGSTLNLFATAPPIPGGVFLWTGPNGFTSNLANPIINNPTTANSGTYSVVCVANGCTSPVATTVVVVNPLPTAPDINSNSPICEGQTLNFTVATVAGATYMWTGPNGFMSNTQNPAIPNAMMNRAGIYSLKVVVNGCTSANTPTVTVTIKPIPSPTLASSNSPVCATGILNLSATTVPGATYAWAGPNAFTSAAQNPSINNVSTAASGIYTVTTTVNGCTALATSTTVVQIPARPTITLTSGSTAICAGNPYNMSFQLNGSGPWTVSYTENNIGKTFVLGEGTSTAPFNTTVALMPMSTTTYTVTGVTDATGCSNTANSTVVVTVNAKPTLSLSAANATICAGTTATYTLTLTGKGPWTVPFSINGNPQTPLTLGNAGSPSPSVFTQTVTPAATTTYTFGNVTDGNNCSYTSGQSFVVNVKPSTSVSTTNTNTSICAGQTVNLSLTLTGQGPWTVNYTANGSPKVVVVGNSNSPSPSTIAVVLTPTATTTYALVGVTSANDCSASATTSFVVTVNPQPTAVFLGGVITTCSGAATNLDLKVTGKGPWNVAYSNGTNTQNITVGNAGSPSPSFFILTVTPTANAIYSIESVVDGNNCGGAVVGGSSVIVNVAPSPTAQLLSNDVTICAGEPVLFTFTVTGQGPWTINYNENSEIKTVTVGTAFSSSPSTFTLTLTPMVNTMYRLNQVTTGQCSAAGNFGMFNATVNPTPTVAFTNLTTLNICKNGTAELNVAVTGKGPWVIDYTANGVAQTTVVGDANSPSPSTFGISVSPATNTTYTLVKVTGAGNCMAMAQLGSVEVHIYPQVSATLTGASSPSVCMGQSAVLQVSLSGQGPWTIGLNGSDGSQQSWTLGNAVSPSPSVFMVTVSPTQNTTYSLVSVNNPVCSGIVTGSVAITVKPKPTLVSLTANGGVTSLSSCTGSPVVMTVVVTGKGPWAVNYLANGSPKQLNFGNVNSPSPSTFTFVVAPTVNTTYTITSVADGNACSSSNIQMNNTVTVQVNPKPTALFNSPSIVTICEGESAALTIALTGKGPWTINYLEGGLPKTVILGTADSPSPTVQTLFVSPTQNTNYALLNVTDGNGCTNTAGTTRQVRVRPRPTVELLSTNDTSVCTGTAAMIRLRFTGTGPWTLNYAINDSISVIPQAFGTANSPSPSTFEWMITPTATATYHLEGLSGGDACTNSATQSIKVNVLPLNNSTALITGVNNPICLGQTAMFPVTLTGVAPWTISYSENGGVPIVVSGINNSPYMLTVTPTGTGTRTFGLNSVIGSGPCPVPGTFTGFAIVNVNPSTTPTATINTFIQSGTVCINQPVTIPVILTGVAPWSVTYRENGGTPITVNNITSSPYMLTVTPTASGVRSFTITQVTESATCTIAGTGTGTAVLEVTPNTQATASIPAGQNSSVCPNQFANITVNFTGIGPWKIVYKENNGAPITVMNITANPYTLTVVPSGVGARTFTLTSVSDVISCGTGSVSGSAVVTVQPISTPTAALSGFIPSACQGQPAVFNVNLSGVGPWTITYTENGANPTTISGITNSPYQLTVTPTALGFRTYSITQVIDSSPCPQGATIGSASVTVNESSSPTAVLSGSAVTCNTTPVTLNVVLTGTAPWTITYTTNGNNPQTVSNIFASPYQLSITPSILGTVSYTLTNVTDASPCGVGSASGTGTVTRLNAPSISVINKTDVNCGSSSGGFVVSAGLGFLYSIDGINFGNSNGVFTGLSAGTYTVTAKNGDCIATTTITIINITAPPTITSITNITDFSMVVNWTALPGALSYNVLYRPLGSTQAFASISVSGNSSSATLVNLQPATTYEIKVEAICGGGTTPVSSGFSPTQTATTLLAIDPSGCNLPANLGVNNITTTSASISWNLTNSAGPVCYIVRFGPLSVSPDSWASVLVPHPGTSTIITGLTTATQYGVSIRTNCSLCSARSGVRSNWSPTVTFNTPSAKDAFVSSSKNQSSLHLYPNPNRGMFSLSVSTPQAGTSSIRILDLTGRVVLNQTANLTEGSNTLPFDLTTQPAGMYVVEFTDVDGNLHPIKVVVN